MTKEIVIDGYLIQQKLETALKEIVGSQNWRGREVRLPTGRRRWDMSYQIDERVTIVEFDGDEHYRNTLKIKADEEKDAVARQYGFHVVRIPYWVQLTNETLWHYFSLRRVIKQEFPHGFITTKVFPASFCELGVARFEQELASLPENVRTAVWKSLRDRTAEHGIRYVLPTKLHSSIEPMFNS